MSVDKNKVSIECSEETMDDVDETALVSFHVTIELQPVGIYDVCI